MKESIWYRISFRAKLFISYFLLLSISTIIMSGLCVNIIKKDAYLRSEKSYNDILQQMTDSLSYKSNLNNISSEFLKNNRALLQALQRTDTTPWQRYLNFHQVVDPLIESVTNNNPQLSSVKLYHNNPVLVNHSPTAMTLDTLGSPPWLDSVLAGQDVCYTENGYLYYYSSFPRLYRNAPDVILEMRVDSSVLFSFRIDSLESYAISVLDQAGSIMWIDNKAEISPENIQRTSECGGETIHVNETIYRLYSQAVPETQWRIQLMLDQSNLHHGADHFVTAVTLIAASCFLSALFISFFISRSMTSRISLLNHYISLVEHGHLHALIQTKYRDEIGMLMTHFNDMTKALRRSIDKQKEAEMRALRSQINPHFLYNTLSLISWKAIEQNAEDVAHLIIVFSRFCRTVLNRGNSQSSVAEEIQNVSYYVEIQQEMHNNTFTVEYDIDEEFYSYVVPNFIVQPLVENAVIHGLDHVRNLQGKLCIRVTEERSDLLIHISNNGKPFLADQLDEILSSEEKGYGLRNVQQRIIYLYGPGYGVSIVQAEEPYTTCVQLRLKKQV